MSDVESLVEDFTSRLAALLESQTLQLARQAVETALGAPGRGRPSDHGKLTSSGRPRKKPPIQLCPVPGCRNSAAPVFGMVCSEHKNVPKAKIKKYREARRAAKAGKAARPIAAMIRRKRRPLSRQRRRAVELVGRHRPVNKKNMSKAPAAKTTMAPAPAATSAPAA